MDNDRAFALTQRWHHRAGARQASNLRSMLIHLRARLRLVRNQRQHLSKVDRQELFEITQEVTRWLDGPNASEPREITAQGLSSRARPTLGEAVDAIEAALQEVRHRLLQAPPGGALRETEALSVVLRLREVLKRLNRPTEASGGRAAHESDRPTYRPTDRPTDPPTDHPPTDHPPTDHPPTDRPDRPTE